MDRYVRTPGEGKGNDPNFLRLFLLKTVKKKIRFLQRLMFFCKRFNPNNSHFIAVILYFDSRGQLIRINNFKTHASFLASSISFVNI